MVRLIGMDLVKSSPIPIFHRKTPPDQYHFALKNTQNNARDVKDVISRGAFAGNETRLADELLPTPSVSKVYGSSLAK